MPDFKQTVTYTLPTAGDQINSTGVLAKGSFEVEYTYRDNGSFKDATIKSSNITTSGGTGGDTVYNNTFNERSGYFDALDVKENAKDKKPDGGDHIGASISFNDATGALNVKFQELQLNTNNVSNPGIQDNDYRWSDYNQLNLTFIDTAAKNGSDADLSSAFRTLEVSNLTVDYDRKDASATSIADIGGSDDTITACYCKGTLIMTATGELAVEELAVGDQVMTSAGNLEPVIWVGNSTINCERQLHKDKAYPVRIVKDAFGLNLPKRDLFVSPDHSLYVDGVMIPAYCLVNGTTITQDQTEKLVTYYHVELPKHNAILAEGLPAESYLETSEENRHFFKQSDALNVIKIDVQYVACPEDTPAWKHIWNTQGYAPLTQSGPILESVKAKLELRALELIAKKELQAA